MTVTIETADPQVIVIVQFQLQNSYDVDSDPEVIVILQFLHLYTLQFSIYITGSTSFFYIFAYSFCLISTVLLFSI